MFHILFVTILFLLSNQPVLAADGNTEAFQGIINSTEGAPKYLIVHERKILLDEKVEIKDHKEKDAAISDLKNGKWVYIVTEEKPAGTTALRIYLLPKRLKDNEKHNYPFIQREEEPKD